MPSIVGALKQSEANCVSYRFFCSIKMVKHGGVDLVQVMFLKSPLLSHDAAKRGPSLSACIEELLFYVSI